MCRSSCATSPGCEPIPQHIWLGWRGLLHCTQPSNGQRSISEWSLTRNTRSLTTILLCTRPVRRLRAESSVPHSVRVIRLCPHSVHVIRLCPIRFALLRRLCSIRVACQVHTKLWHAYTYSFHVTNSGKPRHARRKKIWTYSEVYLVVQA